MILQHGIVAFTGHRPDKLGGYKPCLWQTRIRSRLIAEIQKLDPAAAITGMALGIDQWAAEECFFLGIPFVAAVPFEGQELRWPPESQRHYRDIIARAFKVHLVSKVRPVGPREAADMLQARNRWMADACDHLLAVWDGSEGGTGNCVKYAQRIGKPITIINPKELLPS